MGVEPKIRGFTPNHPFVYRVFPLFSPSILGYPYFWKHPNGWRIKVGKRSTSIRRSHVFFFFFLPGRGWRIHGDCWCKVALWLWASGWTKILGEVWNDDGFRTGCEFKKSWRMMDFQIPSLKLTYPLKIDPWKRRFLLETIIFRSYVSFREGIFLIPYLCQYRSHGWNISKGVYTFFQHRPMPDFSQQLSLEHFPCFSQHWPLESPSWQSLRNPDPHPWTNNKFFKPPDPCHGWTILIEVMSLLNMSISSQIFVNKFPLEPICFAGIPWQWTTSGGDTSDRSYLRHSHSGAAPSRMPSIQ